jgi:hypothetical protein
VLRAIGRNTDLLKNAENFVSKIHVGEREDRPTWMGTVDFSGLKVKLIASLVAISAIALLRAFLPPGDANARVDEAQLRWMVVIHLTFVVSGVLLAVMDWVSSRVMPHEPAPELASNPSDGPQSSTFLSPSAENRGCLRDDSAARLRENFAGREPRLRSR